MDDFIEQNKMALVEEMMESISAISSIIEDAITKEAGSADDIKNSFIWHNILLFFWENGFSIYNGLCSQSLKRSLLYV